MPSVTLYEDNHTQLSFFNKPYLFQIKKVDISIIQISEKSSFLEEDSELTTKFYMRSNKAYNEFIKYALRGYVNIRSIENSSAQQLFYEINNIENSVTIKGDCTDFILYLGHNNYMSKKLNKEIIDTFNTFKEDKQQKINYQSCSII